MRCDRYKKERKKKRSAAAAAAAVFILFFACAGLIIAVDNVCYETTGYGGMLSFTPDKWNVGVD